MNRRPGRYVRSQTAAAFPKWDCINASQRKNTRTAGPSLARPVSRPNPPANRRDGPAFSPALTEPPLRQTCMGLFLSSGCFWVLLTVLCSERESRSSSRRLRSGSRSARKGSRDRNASGAWRLAALAWLVFRSALTPEHAEGRWNSEMGFSLRSSGVCGLMMIRGELAIGAHLRAAHLYSVGPFGS